MSIIGKIISTDLVSSLAISKIKRLWHVWAKWVFWAHYIFWVKYANVQYCGERATV